MFRIQTLYLVYDKENEKKTNLKTAPWTANTGV